jgi:hypothetical protein
MWLDIMSILGPPVGADTFGATMGDKERRRIWSHVSVDSRTGMMTSRVMDYLSTDKGRASLDALTKFRLANEAEPAEGAPGPTPGLSRVPARR